MKEDVQNNVYKGPSTKDKILEDLDIFSHLLICSLMIGLGYEAGKKIIKIIFNKTSK